MTLKLPKIIPINFSMRKLIKIATRMLVLLPFVTLSEPSGAASNNEQVILLHGIARSASHMDDLEEYLKEKGYTVFNLDYPSTEHDLETLTTLVAGDIRERISPSMPVHFVGYSMGGIVTRAILNNNALSRARPLDERSWVDLTAVAN